jgi:uncharacterized 2Fe-2S/4Fe-4S cluster protein (DUF4445 family)
MAEHTITFLPDGTTVTVTTGALLSEAARLAGIDLLQPCGGQGRCGRCAVIIKEGSSALRRRSTLRLSAEDVEAGYALACQTVVEGDAVIEIPPQEKIERRLTTDRAAADITLPFVYDRDRMQTVRIVDLSIEEPSLADQTDDLSRLLRALAAQAGEENVTVPLPLLRRMGGLLRQADWQVRAVLETDNWFQPDGPTRLIDLWPYDVDPTLWGLAIDIGTTTVTVLLANLVTGEIAGRAADYNGQIARGEDVISRIIYAGKGEGHLELRQRVLDTINALAERLCKHENLRQEQIVKATVAGNSTMLHLLLDIDAASIRLMPFITAVNQTPPLLGCEVGLAANALASVDCLPNVASYVGADITAGVLSSGLQEAEDLTLFMDIGTNGELVLGNREWLVTCACSAGPAFEGAGVVNGMRATRGAIEEVWVSSQTFEPTYRVIGSVKPRGLCGSALISLLAELFISGVMDKGGNIKLDLEKLRVREGDHGPEYVVAWADETESGQDITLTKVDIDNLLRAKAAIYAGYTVMADSVGVNLADVEQVLIGGSFGRYINVEKAIQIGLLPDLPWERFRFLGNTSVRGALLALLNRDLRVELVNIAEKMTYIELSADNTFYDAFTSALFLPHTDLARFPSVQAIFESDS